MAITNLLEGITPSLTDVVDCHFVLSEPGVVATGFAQTLRDSSLDPVDTAPGSDMAGVPAMANEKWCQMTYGKSSLLRRPIKVAMDKRNACPTANLKLPSRR